eukprot:1157177-Pelagomonas_calceolata.AAC.4
MQDCRGLQRNNRGSLHAFILRHVSLACEGWRKQCGNSDSHKIKSSLPTRTLEQQCVDKGSLCKHSPHSL